MKTYKNNKQVLENELLNKDITINKVNDSYETIKKDLISTKNERINDLEKRKKKLDSSIEKNINDFKKKITYSIVFYYLAIITLILVFSWDTMEVLIVYLLQRFCLFYSLGYIFLNTKRSLVIKILLKTKEIKLKKTYMKKMNLMRVCWII